MLERQRTFRKRTVAGRGGQRNGDLMNATGGDCHLVDRVRVVNITYTVSPHGEVKGRCGSKYSVA